MTRTGSKTTPRRTKQAGLAGIVGGVGGLLGSFVGLGLVDLSIGNTGIGVGPGALSVLYPVWHVLFAIGVLAANARYGSRYGRGGCIVATLLALSMVVEAGSILLLVMGWPTLGERLLPIGVFHAMLYLAIRLFGSLYGISLWRHSNASRLTAVLFIVLFPAVFILPPLTLVGFPPVLIGAPLDLAFIALGYELWTGDADTFGRGNEVMG